MRRDEIREKGLAHKALMYKTRFIWLKNPWNLTEHQTIRLGALERLNLKINRAYLLNELFRAFWAYHRAGWAKRYLTRWFWWATHSRLAPMRDFAWLVRRHEDDILNSFRMPIDNGTVEGLNQSEAGHPQGVRLPHRHALHPESLPLPAVKRPRFSWTRI